MSVSNIKVVGAIAPPPHKNPAAMLRNIADDIEAGVYGDIETIVVALAGSTGYETFGGGRDSSLPHCAYLFGTAQHRLLGIPWNAE